MTSVRAKSSYHLRFPQNIADLWRHTTSQIIVCLFVCFNPIRPELFGGAWILVVFFGGEGGGRKVPAAYNSKTIHGIEMKFGRVVESHKLINLV